MILVTATQNFILVLAAFIIVISQQTQPPTDIFKEDHPVQDVCNYLVETDNKLVEKYSAPVKGEGQAIMTLVRKYNDALAVLVRKAMQEKTNNETASTIAESQTLIDHGGPQFINFYVERPILENRFGLNNVSSRILCAQRQNTIDIWQDFYDLYSLISDDDDVSKDSIYLISNNLANANSNNELRELCEFINNTDFKIKNIYHILPKRRGDNLLKHLNSYNKALSELTEHIVANNSFSEPSCRYVLRPGAARYFYALYDDELLKYFFKWTPPYTKNKGKYEEMLDYRVAALAMWDKLHDFLTLDYFDFYTNFYAQA